MGGNTPPPTWTPLAGNQLCETTTSGESHLLPAKGKHVKLSNKRSSCRGCQTDDYLLPVVSIPNSSDSLSAPPIPATPEKFNKRAQDKHPSSKVSGLIEEWGRGENQMAKEEVSSYQPEIKKQRSEVTKAIDLLGTPNKGPPRKKHRPKVLKEGKPSRTPKIATSPLDMDGASCKRKYVWRNKDGTHSLEKENTSCRRKYTRRSKDVAHSSNTNAESARRRLNFDSEDPQVMEEFSAAMLVTKNKVLGDPGGDVLNESGAASSSSAKASYSNWVQDQFAVKSSTHQSQNECLQQIPVPYAEVNKNICALDEQIPSLKSSVKHFKALARKPACSDSSPPKSSSEISQSYLNPLGISDSPPKGTKLCHLSADEAREPAQKRIAQSYNLRVCSSKSHAAARQNSSLARVLKAIRMKKWGHIEANPKISPSWEMKRLSNNLLEFKFADAQRFMAQEKAQISDRILAFHQAEKYDIKNAGLEDDISPPQKSANIGVLDARNLNWKMLYPETISADCQSKGSFNVPAYSNFYSGALAYINPVDCIVEKLRHLYISSHHEVAGSHPQNAMVRYVGHGFMMVPYDRSFELAKRRRRPRAKVHLDPESKRVWKFLMGKGCGEGGEPPDVDKEKWWDEERRVLQGRVDSFIAQMNLIQGDRRYSQWKGSVVDSVVGVFLTQNVSDHLSSSAFMSLAANFPLSSRGKFSVPETERANTSMESQNRSLFDNELFFKNSVEVSATQNGEGKETSNHSEILGSTTRSSIIYYSRQKGKGKGPNSQKREAILCQESTVGGSSGSMVNDLGSSSFTKLLRMAEITGLKEFFNNIDIPVRVEPNLKAEIFPKTSSETANSAINTRKTEKSTYDWESLRKEVCCSKPAEERSSTTMDSLDWEAVRTADVSKVAEAIRTRGMNNVLAERIQDFLNRLVREHGGIDLEWLRDVSPDKVKDYLLSIRGLGLKSAECVRLLTLRQLAFPVDTNVGRICVRLGWVPLQPLPESLQLHLLEMYPVLATIQKYLWPRLCKLDQCTLYELHYQMITFGKVFCTKSKPNCNSCPMRGECRHFASAFASARLALPAPEDKSLLSLTSPIAFQNNGEPIIEEPASPEPECQESLESAIEDAFYEDPEEIPTIKLNLTEFTQNLRNYMEKNTELQDGSLSKALVTLTPEAASIPMPKLKNVSRLRTEHQVYEIPDTHPLLELKGLDPREPDDPSPYLLAIWTPGETAHLTEPPKADCNFQDVGQPCERSTCFGCNSMREAESHKIRGTLLIPCRTAMRGSFPLNGTYFQVNEVFADHHSSREPISVLRDWIWNLPRRTVYFGTSIPTIFKGLTTEGIQQCFWRGGTHGMCSLGGIAYIKA